MLQINAQVAGDCAWHQLGASAGSVTPVFVPVSACERAAIVVSKLMSLGSFMLGGGCVCCLTAIIYCSEKSRKRLLFLNFGKWGERVRKILCAAGASQQQNRRYIVEAELVRLVKELTRDSPAPVAAADMIGMPRYVWPI